MTTDFDALLQAAQARWQQDQPPPPRPAKAAPVVLAPVLPPAKDVFGQLRAELSRSLGDRAAGLAPRMADAEQLLEALYPQGGGPALVGPEREAAQDKLMVTLNDIEDIMDALLIFG